MNRQEVTHETEEVLLNGACDLASMIHKYIREHKELHQCGMTAIGYAIEMIISQLGADKWDSASKEFRDFLAVAHRDLKGLVKEGIVRTNINDDLPS